ncbi:hypothetical protein [Bacillus sp. 03113]|uniref:hypothetical protein n=1 Tax=Bacillus sp. 03113 TaxID=2578211 RepID=UPI0011440BA0|nr:hypothetical protein [Bacillus sp. 03113]
MNFNCACNETNELIIEGDVGADPIWCSKCGCNLEIEALSVSKMLEMELSSWAMTYGEWIDWDKDVLLPNGIVLEKEFNARGLILTEKVKQEIGDQYKIKFSPSSSTRLYAKKEL